jgi:glycosyltransferase involved in cell wall biosynthesis
LRILLVNKFHYLKGGSETYYFELAKLLREKGHTIAFFSMQNEQNIKTDFKEYFVENIDLNGNNKLKALDVIYSKKNKQKMLEAIEDFKPDIIHINNFQRQLSSSIIEAANEKNIPVVFTAHDEQAICPAITMLDSSNNICEDCKNGKYINCIKKGCVKNSKLKSVLGAIEGYYYRAKKVYTKKIAHIITPSEFLKQKLVEDGIPANNIDTIYNFIDEDKFNIETQDDGYALFFGRLSKEKGVLNLIEAFASLNKGTLYIAGTGPEQEKIESVISKKGLENRVKLLGLLNSNEMKEKVRKCKFVVLPSIWYENCPYSIIEALTLGKPVIGSKIGGIPELVIDGKNGFTYEYNDRQDLACKMDKLFTDSELVKQMGENAKINAKKLYSKDTYYDKIIKVYEQVLNGGK